MTNESLADDLRELVEECNQIVRNKRDTHIQGEVTSECLDAILIQSSVDLCAWKIFFLSFLHNNGRPNDFKENSPFISLTYGSKKMTKGREFALSRCSNGRRVVFLYSLSPSWPHYVLSKKLTDQLSKYGVQWYKDIHHEVMLLNGMYPNFLLGFFEVSKTRTHKFILNPWLCKAFEKNQEFNYTEGIDIDQTKFKDFAQDLNYKSFFSHDYGRQHECVSDLGSSEVHSVFRV